MSKKIPLSPGRARERALFVYASALERGDFEAVAAVLRLAERDATLDQMIKDLDALNSPPEERQTANGLPPSNNKYIQQIVTVSESFPDGQTPEFDHHEEEDSMYITYEPTRSDKSQWVFPRVLTIAAAILILIFIGGLLIEMVNDPIDGYPAIQALQTEEPTCETGLDYMVQGKANISTGDYEAALTAYTCAIEIDPTNYVAHMWRGGLAAANGDYDQLALDLYTIEIHRSNGSDPLEVAIASEVTALDDIIELRPDDFVPYLLRVVASWIPFESGVTPSLERMIELQPENPLGYLFMGALNIGNASSLPEAFGQGMTLAPDTVLIDWLMRRNEFQFVDVEAQKARLDRVIEKNPNHPFAYHFRAQDYVQLDNFAAAAQDFYQHLQISQLERVEVDGLMPGERIDMDGVTGRVFQLPFTAQAGQKLSLIPDENRNNNGIVNPIVVLDSLGNVVTVPYVTTSVNVVIRDWEVPEDGTYTALLMSSSSTELTLQVTIDPTPLTTFSSELFAIPMNLSFNADWHITDDFTDLVTVKRSVEGWELGFNIVTSATVADPVSGDQIPFPTDFSSWIQSNPDFQADQPTQITVGGIQGLQIDVTPMVMAQKTFLYMSEIRWNLIAEPERWRFILLDGVNGERVLILFIASAGQFDAAVQKAQAVLNNVVFSS